MSTNIASITTMDQCHIIRNRCSYYKRILISFKCFESCFLLISFSPHLIFGCDETMIEEKPRRMCLYKSQSNIVLEEAFSQKKHITGMMSHCFTGQALPPFIILNSFQNAKWIEWFMLFRSNLVRIHIKWLYDQRHVFDLMFSLH